MGYNSFTRRPAQSRSAHFGGGRRPNYNRKPANRGQQYIHPSKFVNKAVMKSEEAPYEATHAFVDFPLSNILQDNIAARGYSAPSAIQDQAIPHILDGKDLIGLANTGTGKTAAFLIPVIERIQYNDKQYASALIVTPTRELANQIDEQFRDFAKGMKLYSAVCVGGMNIDRQIRDLNRRPHVVIGTPGRIKDLLNRRALRLQGVQVLVLDEADRMLDMGFVNDIKHIIQHVSEQRQSLCFSATITPAISTLIHEMLQEPVTVSVRTAETSEHVDQDVIKTESKDHKVEVLKNMLADEEYEKVLVFGQTKFGVQRLSDALNKAGHAAEAIHGNKSQPQRQRALNKFRNDEVKVLVATDVAARGLDIPNVSHVINFDQPNTYDDYIHRIGRTGRGGAKGKAYTFID